MWIARREKCPDIAFAQSAENSVSQRMHGRIRVGMALQFFVMGDFNTAQHYPVSRFKLVKINTLPHAHIEPLGIYFRHQELIRHNNIFSRGQLAVFNTPRNHPHLDTKFFRYRRVICEAQQFLLMGFAVGRMNGFQSEALRCLH